VFCPPGAQDARAGANGEAEAGIRLSPLTTHKFE